MVNRLGSLFFCAAEAYEHNAISTHVSTLEFVGAADQPTEALCMAKCLALSILWSGLSYLIVAFLLARERGHIVERTEEL